MLTPNYLNNQLPARLVDIMGELETEMLKKVAQHISKYGKVTGTAEFLALKQTQYNLLYDDLVKVVSNYSNKTKREIMQAFTEAAIKSTDYDNRIIMNAGIKTASAVATSSSLALNRTLQIALTRAIDIQNLTNTQCIQSALALFTRATDKAYLGIISGSKTFDQAYRQAVDELAKSGLTIVDYARNGKELHYSVEAVTRRNLITSVNQTAGKISIQNAHDLGCHLVEVTSHAGARPSHAEWQGGIYWIDEPVKGYGSLVDICGYGEIDGLCGINCYHSFMPYFEGSPKVWDKDPARNQLGINNEELYNLNQKQRYLEREIRNAKKEQAIYEQAGMTSESKEAGAKVRERQKNIREFLSQNPLLHRDYIREKIG